MLLKTIVSDEHASRGLYTFQFHKHGAWRHVVVDNRLPCLELQQRLAFASSCTPQVCVYVYALWMWGSSMILTAVPTALLGSAPLPCEQQHVLWDLICTRGRLLCAACSAR